MVERLAKAESVAVRNVWALVPARKAVLSLPSQRPLGKLSSFQSFHALFLLYCLFMSFLHIHTKFYFLIYFTSHILLYILLSDLNFFYFILLLSPLEVKTVV